MNIAPTSKSIGIFNTYMPTGTISGRSISSSLRPAEVLVLGVLGFLACAVGRVDPLFPTEALEEDLFDLAIETRL